MKIKLLVVFATTLLSISLQAQKKKTKQTVKNRFYIQLQGGYGKSTQNKSNFIETYIVSGSQNNYTETLLKKGFGSGANFGLLVGKNLSDNIAVELGASYFKGDKLNINQSTFSGGDYVKVSYNTKMINILPSLVIKTKKLKSTELYAKMGPVIGLNGEILSVGTLKNGNDINVVEQVRKKGIAWGIQSAVGLNFSISNRISFITELNLRDQSFSPKEGEITKFTKNGSSLLNALSVSGKKFIYTNKVSPNDNLNIGLPSKKLKEYNSLSALGLQIGFRFKF